MNGLFDSFGAGVVTDPIQAKALNAQELAAMQQRQFFDMQQAAPDLDFAKYQNWQPPQRPLDERFADFKVRLAAALERKKGPTP